MSIIFLVLYFVFCKYRCRNKLPFLPFFFLGKFQKVMYQWLIQGGYPSLFLDQAEARVAVVIFLSPGPPHLRVWMTGPHLPSSPTPLSKGLDQPLRQYNYINSLQTAERNLVPRAFPLENHFFFKGKALGTRLRRTFDLVPQRRMSSLAHLFFSPPQ